MKNNAFCHPQKSHHRCNFLNIETLNSRNDKIPTNSELLTDIKSSYTVNV